MSEEIGNPNSVISWNSTYCAANQTLRVVRSTISTSMNLPLCLLAFQHLNYSSYLTVIKEPIADFLLKVNPFDVQFIVHSSDDGDVEIVNEIYKTVARASPSSIISLNDTIPRELPFIHVSDRTFILYVYASKRVPDSDETKSMIEVMSHSEIANPKVLLITLLEERDHNFESFMKKTWGKRILHVTILDVGKSDGETVINLHQYNPFTEVYEQFPYSSGVQWFPDKTRDLCGYPFKVYMKNHPSHLTVKTDSQLYPVEYTGPDANTLQTLASKLNFSIELLNKLDDRMDMLIPMLPYFRTGEVYLTQEKTVAYDLEEWCPLVPILYKESTVSMKVLYGILFSNLLLLIFWIISLVFKFDPRTWRLLEIHRLLISASALMRPKKPVERIIYCSCMLVSAISASSILSMLTSEMLHDKTEIEFNDFDEFNRSGLTLKMPRRIIDVIFEAIDDPTYSALKKKVGTFVGGDECVEHLVKYKNTSCFMDTRNATMYIYSYRKRGKDMRISSKLCLAKRPMGYFLNKRTTFKHEIDIILTSLRSSGIYTKWQQNFSRTVEEQGTRSANVNVFFQTAVTRNLVYIAGFGYLLSFFVLIVEVMMHRADR